MKKILILLMLLSFNVFSAYNYEKNLEGHKDEVTALIYSPNGKYIISGSRDETVKMWDVSTRKNLKTFIGHKGTINSLSYSYDGKYIASGSEDKTINIWDVKTGKLFKSLIGHESEVVAVEFNPVKNELASLSVDNQVIIWDVKTGKKLLKLEGEKGVITSISYSPNGKELASAGINEPIKIWNIELGILKKIKTIGKDFQGSYIDYNQNGTNIVIGNSKIIRIIDVSNGKELKKFDKMDSSIVNVSYSPKNEYLLIGTGTTVQIINLKSGVEVTRLIGSNALFSPMENTLAISQGENIKIIDFNYLLNQILK